MATVDGFLAKVTLPSCAASRLFHLKRKKMPIPMEVMTGRRMPSVTPHASPDGKPDEGGALEAPSAAAASSTINGCGGGGDGGALGGGDALIATMLLGAEMVKT